MELASVNTEPVTELLPDVSAWGVAHTKSRCEKALAEYLVKRDVPHFLPLVTKRRVYGRRKRTSHMPLFPGYVFFDRLVLPRTEIFESRRVAEILVPSDDLELCHELRQLATALQADESLRETRFGQVGRKVLVARGPLKGLQGEIARVNGGTALILRVSFLGRAVELGIDEAFVEPIL